MCSMRQQQVKSQRKKQGINYQRPLPAALEPAADFRRVRQGLGPLIEVGQADHAKDKAQRDQYAADDFE